MKEPRRHQWLLVLRLQLRVIAFTFLLLSRCSCNYYRVIVNALSFTNNNRKLKNHIKSSLLWPPWRGPKQILNVGPWGKKIDKHVYSKFRRSNKEPTVLHIDLARTTTTKNSINIGGAAGTMKPSRLLPEINDDVMGTTTTSRTKRVIFISDTHDKHHSIPQLPKADILIHCGDILQQYGYFPGSSSSPIIKRLNDFDDWLSKQTHINHKLIIGGNHDDHVQRHSWKPRHGILLDGSTMHNIDGLNIFGSPYSPLGVTNNNAFQQKDLSHNHINTLLNEQQQDAEENDAVLDILVTHARCSEFEKHALFKSNTRIWAHGHYHNQYGIDTIVRKNKKHKSKSKTYDDDTDDNVIYCINAATCTMTYEPINPPIVLDIIPHSSSYYSSNHCHHNVNKKQNAAQ